MRSIGWLLVLKQSAPATSLSTGVVRIKEGGKVETADETNYDVWSDQAAAHWRFSLAGVSSWVSAGAEGRGGASHRQRRMMR